MDYRCLINHILLFVALATLPELAAAKTGLNFGFGTENRRNMFSMEALLRCDPIWEFGDIIKLDISPEASLGFLNGHDETAALAHIGLAASFSFDDFPIALICSSGPTILTEDTFGTYDLGSLLEFTSKIGLDFKPISNWTVGYNYMHISNASIGDKNPGLNMHAIAIFHDF